MNNDLNDSLEDIFGIPMSDVPRNVPTRQAPEGFVENKTFIEGCKDCRGTGWWRPGYRCFKCKGAGKLTFKSSPEARANERAKAAQKRQDKAAELLAEVQTWQVANSEAWAWMRDNAPTFGFASSMVEALHKFGSLTEGQMAAVNKCIKSNKDRAERRAAEQAQRVADAPVVNVSKLEQAFATARSNAARPGMQGIFMKPIKLTSGDVTVKVTQGSQGSQWEGMLFIKNDDGKKLGHVKSGKFVRNYVCEDVEAAAVVDCLNDPEKAAVAYGKAYSRCGICGRGLLNDESIARGIGPVCAENFGW